MKITRVIIRNWRSVKDADFEPADMTILVGANNAGKTNILSAINFLMGDRWPMPGNLLDSDFYLSDRQREIFIQLDFEDAPYSRLDFDTSRNSYTMQAYDGRGLAVRGFNNEQRAKVAFAYVDASRSFDRQFGVSRWTLFGQAVRFLHDDLLRSDSDGQVVPTNPAASVRGPKYVVTTGKTPVLDGSEWRKLLDAIPAETVRDLRDRALIATLTYSFARVGAALKLKVEDLRPQGTGWQIHLHEKGGKEHKMPCHHALAEMLHAYIAAAGIAADRKGWLFRTSPRHNAAVLTEQPMDQKDGWRMIRKHAAAAGIAAPIGNHSCRATGITNFLENGGSLENAQDMAAHASPRTTRLYDRRKDRLKQAEVERIRL